MRPEPIHILALLIVLALIAVAVAAVVLIVVAVRRRARQRSASPAAFGAHGGGRSTADELEKLSGLHLRGVLSDDEFAEQKRRLLGE